MFRTNPGLTHQTVDKKLFSPRRGRIALSVNERIAEFLDFAIQAKFAYVGRLLHKSRICAFSARKKTDGRSHPFLHSANDQYQFWAAISSFTT